MSSQDNLNEAQQKAVLCTEGPLLIVAGAGAGKTKTLTHRIHHLMSEKHIQPERILAVTFTNKAAKEMRERVLQMMKPGAPSGRISWPGEPGIPFIATFHSLGVFFIRENAEALGLPRNFTIFDSNDTIRTIRNAVKAEGFDPKNLDPKLVRSIISQSKSKGYDAADYERNLPANSQAQNILRVWKHYRRVMKEQDALDFDDLLLRSVRLLRNNDAIREKYQHFFQYIHIDEYQDTNQLQYEMAHLLAGKRKNICVVGDADQNIYSWRGADISNILNFEKDYPGAQTILLEQNYRSTDIILRAANAVIEKNSERIPKKLFTDKKGSEKITVIEGFNEYSEAESMTEKIGELTESVNHFGDIAILYRANFQSRVLEHALLAKGIPYQVLGTKFFDRKEVKDVLSYLRAAINPKSIPDVSRSINTPKRGIGKTTAGRFFHGENDQITGKAKEKIDSYFTILENIQEKMKASTVSETIAFAVKESGLEDFYRKLESDGEEQLENMYELVSSAEKYDSLGDEGMEKFLEDAALMSEQDNMEERGAGRQSRGKVRLMTVHASKGLEFPVVFITGLEDGLFPHRRYGEGSTKDQDEEERRLFYVALTRAEKKLVLSHANMRMKFGSKEISAPSEFLADIPEDLVEEPEPSTGTGLLDGFLGSISYD